ncbi:MAG: hypothetical protein ACREQL_01540 [Candidatus Binatia bacterium]
MNRKTIGKAMVVAAVAVGTMVGSSAGAATLHTPPLQPSTGQKLVCTVVNVAGKSMGIVAEIIDRWGDPVTDFVRTDWDATGTALVTVRAESGNPNARFCRIGVTGGRKADVAASLQACTFDESACGSAVIGR